MPRREITRAYPGAGKGLKSLALKNIVIVTEQQVYRDPFGECFLESDIPQELTPEQKIALDSILPAIKEGGYRQRQDRGIPAGCGICTGAG